MLYKITVKSISEKKERKEKKKKNLKYVKNTKGTFLGYKSLILAILK